MVWLLISLNKNKSFTAAMPEGLTFWYLIFIRKVYNFDFENCPAPGALRFSEFRTFFSIVDLVGLS
jgi:hypothetical protein